MSDLWSWTAAELATAIAAGRISSVEATASALGRMAAVNPVLNAVVDGLEEDALTAARAADAGLARGETPGPLHGVPVTVKINTDYKGRATTNSVRAYANLIAPQDGAVVRNLRETGAVIIGRTNAPCYSMRWFTENDLHGATLNPHDAGITAGGSSGGAGSAAAAGIGAMAHGNDIGGSVRYPAYCCGIYGLRPTSGLAAAFNPTQAAERMIASQMMAVQGPLARSVQDIRLAMQVFARPDPRDIWQVPMPPIADPGPCRVAMLAEQDGCEAAVTRAIRRAGAILSDRGYVVEEVAIPSIPEAADLWRVVMVNEMRVGLGPLIDQNGDAAIRYAYDCLSQGVPELGKADFLTTFAQRSRLLRDWQMLFDTHPVVLTATAWQRPYAVGTDLANADSFEQYYRDLSPTTALPILGLPGLSVPVVDGPGFPLGVQLIAGRFQENRLYAAGEAIERANGRLAPVTPG